VAASGATGRAGCDAAFENSVRLTQSRESGHAPSETTHHAIRYQADAPRVRHIASWLTVLKGDKRFIFTAASHAQRAADYLHGLQPQASAEHPEQERAAA